MKSRFEERLNDIISAEGDVNSTLDELEEQRTPLPTCIEYDDVKSAVVAVDGQESDSVDDYLFGRKILYGLINRGTVALEGAMIIARESEHPRAYEVSANIMKSISEMAKDLMKLHESTAPTKVIAPTINKQVNIQNNYSGSNDANQMKDIHSILDSLEDD